jgi:hypothetical protein
MSGAARSLLAEVDMVVMGSVSKLCVVLGLLFDDACHRHPSWHIHKCQHANCHISKASLTPLLLAWAGRSDIGCSRGGA